MNLQNGHRLDWGMLELLRWAREIGPEQPLTVACWHPNDPKFDEIALAESDIVTFHCYGNASTTRKKIAAMSVPGRPVICTEWLYRPNGCDIPNVLCIYKETGVGCMLWGLVNGTRLSRFLIQVAEVPHRH